jgi:hypothetical protein
MMIIHGGAPGAVSLGCLKSMDGYGEEKFTPEDPSEIHSAERCLGKGT